MCTNAVSVIVCAALELPHILVLIDDPNRTVIEPVGAAKTSLQKLYDVDLMLDSGHLAGYAVDDQLEQKIMAALRGLAKAHPGVELYVLAPPAAKAFDLSFNRSR